jgi:hypothetical protein
MNSMAETQNALKRVGATARSTRFNVFPLSARNSFAGERPPTMFFGASANLPT